SRSSSSTRTMGLPMRSSSRTSGMGENGIEPQLDILAFFYRPGREQDFVQGFAAYLRTANHVSITPIPTEAEESRVIRTLGFFGQSRSRRTNNDVQHCFDDRRLAGVA